ncbi:MAG: polysaccharide deacetylase family protein [Bacteroidetes bacterium]|nr:polysaccharide deacetylase family protein [Bacteroidota bacterium]
MSFSNSGGKFIISLDFELMWGVRDLVTTATYGEHIAGVHEAIPKLLACFTRHNIKATFATVGLLFFETKAELLSALPGRKPNYKKAILSPYGEYMEKNLGENHTTDPYHYAPDLIRMIQSTAGQEIGTHTFSHYYCKEEWQTVDDFRDDLAAAISTAQKMGIKITSIIFPRNQFNNDYLAVCKEAGIITYRNNEESWLYNARSGEKETLLRRAIRLMDAYINISGYHCYTEEYLLGKFPVNIPSSRFLRPYMTRLTSLDWLRLRRIKKSMTYAAKNNLMYHLWWHPHNFGINQLENFAFLEEILVHYRYLHEKYNFTSYTMTELANELLAKQPGLKK